MQYRKQLRCEWNHYAFSIIEQFQLAFKWAKLFELAIKFIWFQRYQWNDKKLNFLSLNCFANADRLYQNKLLHPLQPSDVLKFLAVRFHKMQQDHEAKERGELRSSLMLVKGWVNDYGLLIFHRVRLRIIEINIQNIEFWGCWVVLVVALEQVLSKLIN